MIKCMGALLIVLGCGGVGFSMCRRFRALERSFEALCKCLAQMTWELKSRMPPLSELCRSASEMATGALSRTLESFARELDAQLIPDVASCMEAALRKNDDLAPEIAAQLRDIAASLGKFALCEQLEALEAASERAKIALGELREGKTLRLRNYRTLGICAGVALAILLL